MTNSKIKDAYEDLQKEIKKSGEYATEKVKVFENAIKQHITNHLPKTVKIPVKINNEFFRFKEVDVLFWTTMADDTDLSDSCEIDSIFGPALISFEPIKKNELVTVTMIYTNIQKDGQEIITDLDFHSINYLFLTNGISETQFQKILDNRNIRIEHVHAPMKDIIASDYDFTLG